MGQDTLDRARLVPFPAGVIHLVKSTAYEMNFGAARQSSKRPFTAAAEALRRAYT